MGGPRGTEAKLEMAATNAIHVSDHIKKVPPAVRPIVQAARRTVKAAAPTADEISYQSQPPRSSTYMWKIVRYTVGGKNVVGIGTFPRTLGSSHCAPRPTRSGRPSSSCSRRRSGSAVDVRSHFVLVQ